MIFTSESNTCKFTVCARIKSHVLVTLQNNRTNFHIRSMYVNTRCFTWAELNLHMASFKGVPQLEGLCVTNQVIILAQYWGRDREGIKVQIMKLVVCWNEQMGIMQAFSIGSKS